ncbi:hypothetical protein DFH28DRAFT_1137485 [Melampsora americana]|nr:hypothetical protein DFH28DRAFT_1137485 [Melampsora americana]
MRFSQIYEALNQFPSVLDSLDGQDVFRFVTVASHFVTVNQGSIKVDQDNAPYDYLNSALSAPVIPGTWEVLWTVLYPTLTHSYVEPKSLIRNQGLIQEAVLPIVERIFWPPYQDECPNKHCKLVGRRTLEKRKAICGYLYDLDGVNPQPFHWGGFQTYAIRPLLHYGVGFDPTAPTIQHPQSPHEQILDDPNVTGGGFALRAIAMDGITIGHPRCSATKEQLVTIDPNVPNPPACTIMLETPKDRYCPLHSPLLGKLCHAQPCTRDAIGTTKACDLPEHQEAIQIRQEKTHRSRAALAFNQRTGAKLPEDPTAALDADTDAFNLEALVEGDESDRAHEAGRDGEETFRASNITKKPTCSNAKTHNDLLFVGTCGITLARDTMYRAESVILVREALERKFPVLPPIQFFDNSCTFDKSLRKDPQAMERFKGTIRPVDPFHMRTHSEKDTQCRKYNDPKRWPFLKKTDGSWRFNGSAAEITNAWYGGFPSICRGMHEINYRFFLEEMIRVRNDSLLTKLVWRTNFCCNVPSHLAKPSPFPLSV